MPQTVIQVFKQANGQVPLIVWLGKLEEEEPVAYAKCIEAILRLESRGSELRRPHADALRDGIKELRIRQSRVNYRILYAFNGQNIALLTHGIIKEGQVPPKEIDKAIRFKQLAVCNPNKHIAKFPNDEGKDEY